MSCESKLCANGYDCLENNCVDPHETLDEYNERISKVSEIKWDTKYTYEGRYNDFDVPWESKIMCICTRCPQLTSRGNPVCSDQCGDFDQNNTQLSLMSHKKDGFFGRSCRHEHSKCMMIDCNRAADMVILYQTGIVNPIGVSSMSKGLDMRILQPFCKYHAPKCFCGRPRFTELYISYEKRNVFLQKMDLIDTLYNKVCPRHRWACSTENCTKICTHIKYQGSMGVYYRMNHHMCPDHAPVCHSCHKELAGPRSNKGEYSHLCINCDQKFRDENKVIGKSIDSNINCDSKGCRHLLPLIYCEAKIYKPHSSGNNWFLQSLCYSCAPKCSCGQAKLAKSDLLRRNMPTDVQYYDGCYDCSRGPSSSKMQGLYLLEEN